MAFNSGATRSRAGAATATCAYGTVRTARPAILTAVRTGQAHRTLAGHTAPVTCLQFDESYIVSGSLDKSIRVRRPAVRTLTLQIWDLRMGDVAETMRFEHPVTALQFDSRKVVSAPGTRALDVRDTALPHTDRRFTTARAKSIRR